MLDDAWGKVVRNEKPRAHILTFVALGGEGKTSLVAKWAADLAYRDWVGCDAAFAWSFYSQGTREQLAASSDLFFKEALIFFGDAADKEFAASLAGAFEKGQRLARIVSAKRTLLILDGLEPLQYAPTATAFKAGELKDQGIAKLLKDVATGNHGLCIVTTRYSLPDLNAFTGKTVEEEKLTRLSRKHGVDLLKGLGVKGSELRNIEYGPNREKVNEFEKLVEEVKGHALTLTLFGGFLKRAFHGDIRQRDRVKFEKVDEKMDGGRAFRTIAAYEQWLLRDGGDEGRREVAVLRLMGLFDRPADASCLAVLQSETIPNLTEPLAGLADDDWDYCLSGLEAAKLLTVNRDASGALISLDAHPHLREYFARQLREQQRDAWRRAHRRLYEHLCATTKEGDEPTLEDLQPLYQAVAHGCKGDLHEEVCNETYVARILKKMRFYSWKKLGAFGSDLSAVACFFERPWGRISVKLSRFNQALVAGLAGLYLHNLGRLAEATDPMRSAIEMARHAAESATDETIRVYQFRQVAIASNNLSELEMTQGAVANALRNSEQAVMYADRSGDANLSRVIRTTNADALHQAGRRAEALERFREAEQMQKENKNFVPLLFSVQGFQYCDLLLTAPERAAWRGEDGGMRNEMGEECRAVSERATKTLQWAEQYLDKLETSLDHLTLVRAGLYLAILESSDFQLLTNELSRVDEALDGLRRAGAQRMIPLGLLTRAWLRSQAGQQIGRESAQEDLDEAWEIAERGPMKLFMADIHLYRARLFGRMRDEGGGMKYPGTKILTVVLAGRRMILRRRRSSLMNAGITGGMKSSRMPSWPSWGRCDPRGPDGDIWSAAA